MKHKIIVSTLFLTFGVLVGCGKSNKKDSAPEPNHEESAKPLLGFWQNADKELQEKGYYNNFLAFKGTKYLQFKACFGECLEATDSDLTEEEKQELNETEIYIPVEYGSFTATESGIVTKIEHTCLPDMGMNYSESGLFEYKILDDNLSLTAKTNAVWDQLNSSTSNWQKIDMSGSEEVEEEEKGSMYCMKSDGIMVEKDWFKDVVVNIFD